MRAQLYTATLVAVLLGVPGCERQQDSPPGAAMPMPLSVIRQGNEITPGEAAAVEAAARDAWPRVNIVNELTINAPGTR